MNRPLYNTEMKDLAMPAYGRNIQNMIDYCVTIEDRDERTRCAYAIAAIMANKFPEKVQNGNNHLLWDHMNLMSGFKLDVDFPCEVITEEEAHPKPDPLAYTQSRIRNRMYGKNLETLIKKVAFMDHGEERDAIIFMLANHMKKIQLANFSDGVDDQKIFHDLEEMSVGQIVLDPATTKLYSYKVDNDQQQQRKKKKKK